MNACVLSLGGNRLYRIDYYRDKNGKSEFEDFYNYLFESGKNNKNNRVLYNTITRFLLYLKTYGTKDLPSDYAKLISEDIWELRPNKYRILYFYYKEEKYVLLHHFLKKSNKTPKKEIERAISERNEYVKKNK